jgi:uncharacterized membrane protein (UPF0127 family)
MKEKFVWAGVIVVVVVTVVTFALIQFGVHVSTPSISPAPVVSALPSSIMVLDGTTLQVDLAITPDQQEKGLGTRSGLAADHGMLFIFPQDGHYEFWMKDMNFSIDIIWLDHNGKVIDVVPDLSPKTFPQAFGPKGLSRFVLEVPAGFAAAHHVQIGDVAQLP